MNLQCKVCGEKAAGFHFGAFTCEGCKSFFGRCCNNMYIVGECRNNKDCKIDKRSRTSCKACRLQKCILAGMSKSGSRYGRRSNWFKQYFQERRQSDATAVISKSHQKRKKDFKKGRVTGYSILSNCENSPLSNVPNQNLKTDVTSNTLSSHLTFNYYPYLQFEFTDFPKPESLNKLLSSKHSEEISEIKSQMDDSFPLDLSSKRTHKLVDDGKLGQVSDIKYVESISNNKNILPLDLSVK